MPPDAGAWLDEAQTEDGPVGRLTLLTSLLLDEEMKRTAYGDIDGYMQGRWEILCTTARDPLFPLGVRMAFLRVMRNTAVVDREEFALLALEAQNSR